MVMLSEYSCSHVSIEVPSDGNDDGCRITPANNFETAANARELPEKKVPKIVIDPNT